MLQHTSSELIIFRLQINLNSKIQLIVQIAYLKSHSTVGSEYSEGSRLKIFRIEW